MPRLVLALVLGGATGCSTPGEPATGLYQWVDDSGVVHYTTDRDACGAEPTTGDAEPACGAEPATGDPSPS